MPGPGWRGIHGGWRYWACASCIASAASAAGPAGSVGAGHRGGGVAFSATRRPRGRWRRPTTRRIPGPIADAGSAWWRRAAAAWGAALARLTFAMQGARTASGTRAGELLLPSGAGRGGRRTRHSALWALEMLARPAPDDSWRRPGCAVVVQPAGRQDVDSMPRPRHGWCAGVGDEALSCGFGRRRDPPVAAERHRDPRAGARQTRIAWIEWTLEAVARGPAVRRSVEPTRMPCGRRPARGPAVLHRMVASPQSRVLGDSRPADVRVADADTMLERPVRRASRAPGPA